MAISDRPGSMAVAPDGDMVPAIRAAIKGYVRRFGTMPAVVYLRPSESAPLMVDGVPVHFNAHIGLRQALAAGE